MLKIMVMVICIDLPVWYSRGVLLRSQVKRTGGGAGGGGFLLFHLDFKGFAVLVVPMLGAKTMWEAMQALLG
jgi:hypothetical protein